MSKKKMYNTQEKIVKKSVILGEELRKQTKNRSQLSFSTGRHMTEKDRPRKKKWDDYDE